MPCLRCMDGLLKEITFSFISIGYLHRITNKLIFFLFEIPIMFYVDALFHVACARHYSNRVRVERIVLYTLSRNVIRAMNTHVNIYSYEKFKTYT